MIDLHIHTNNSDGTDTVIELLKKVEKLKLDCISITDHDNCNAYEQLGNIKVSDYFSGIIIPGIEIKCTYKKRTIEVLGYKINAEKMNNWIKEFYKNKQRDFLQTKYFNLLYDKCKQMGLKLSDKEKIKWNPNNEWASFTIYSDLKKYIENKNIMPDDMWKEFSGFNRKYCNNPNHILFIDKSEDYPTLEQTIHAIKQCGGLVFMPHLFIYKWVENKEKFIEELVNNYEIDGLECYYTDFTEEQTNYILNLCEKRSLFKSGGTDYHGNNKEKISLAKGYGNLQINKDIIEDWI